MCSEPDRHPAPWSRQSQVRREGRGGEGGGEREGGEGGRERASERRGAVEQHNSKFLLSQHTQAEFSRPR